MGMRIRGAAASIAVIVIAAGCASAPSSGRVIDKSHQPGHYYTYDRPVYRTQCSDEDEGGHEEDVCSQVPAYYLPEQIWQAPEWSVELKSGNRAGWRDVTSGTYAQIRIGQWWKVPATG